MKTATKENIVKAFGSGKALIGMVHLDPLPGSPLYDGRFESILNKALQEAEIYAQAGVGSIMIENMHDLPYLNRNVGPEAVSAMSVIAYELKREFNLPMGVQTLAGANKEALAIAKAAGLEFIRAEGFVFAHVADEGIFQSDAGELLRYRKTIDAEDVLIFADVKKKHSSHSITSDVTLIETAKAAEYFLADAVVVTGKTTGDEPDADELKELYSNVEIPVVIGSGINIRNLPHFINLADAFIVGSYFKKDGKWFNKVEKERVVKFVELFNSLREK